MTHTPAFLPNEDGSRLVLFVAYPQMGLLDLTGPQTVFWAASKALEKRGRAGYERQTVSLSGGLVQSSEGVGVSSLPVSDFKNARIDTLVIPGSAQMEAVLDDSTELVEWLRETSTHARRTASVCTGTFLVAQAGLLNQKRAATHWSMYDTLQARFPLIDIDREAIFVREDPIWTSAGVTAGIDLALALVQADCGHTIAMEVARELVVYLKRPGSQAQFSELLRTQTRDDSAFDQLHCWIMDNISKTEITVEALAERVNMSPRHFARVYKERAGRTPAKAVESLRLETAKRLIETSHQSLFEIATSCGFGSEERMRVTFLRALATSPSEFRRAHSLVQQHQSC
jgi:transcriptional regulator GlxA family with amidase domain